MIDCSFKLNDKPMSSFKIGAPSFPAFSGLGKHVNRAISQCISDGAENTYDLYTYSNFIFSFIISCILAALFFAIKKR